MEGGIRCGAFLLQIHSWEGIGKQFGDTQRGRSKRKPEPVIVIPMTKSINSSGFFTVDPKKGNKRQKSWGRKKMVHLLFLITFFNLLRWFPTGFRPQVVFALIYMFRIDIALTEFAKQLITWRRRRRLETARFYFGQNNEFRQLCQLLCHPLRHACLRGEQGVFLSNTQVVLHISNPLGTFSPGCNAPLSPKNRVWIK